MAQNYKVFYNERPVIFTQNPNVSPTRPTPSTREEWIGFVNSLLSHPTKVPPIVLHCEDAERGFEDFKTQFIYLEAAGGLVQHPQKGFLGIFRLGKWDLPKGKIESGENPQEAALREVEEECGIKPEGIVQKIADTYHIYMMNGKHHLKRTHWFLMHYSGSAELVPQTDEDIAECRWVTDIEKNKFLQNTYPAIAEILAGEMNSN